MENVPVISFQNVTKYFGKVAGVKEVSFQVERGEVFGFLGPNGSGKTTTIRLILDLLRPQSGEIEVFGKNLYTHSFEIRGKCGYLPGNFNAYGNLTGDQFLSLLNSLRNPQNFSDPELKRKLGISEFELKRKIKHLSHGTRQKLGLMQAFWRYPEMLILDEPTLGLDPIMQEVFTEMLKEYSDRGITIFLSSHNLTEIERICSRVAIIRKGEIIKTESISILRKMANRKLILTMKKPVENIQLIGARLVRQSGLKFEFEISGDLKKLLSQLAELPMAEMVMPEPDLQEIFRNHYNVTTNEQHDLL